MRTLVTGGAGFIGSHLVEHLLGAGDAVLVLDDLSTGQESNLAGVIDYPRLELRIASAGDEHAVAAAIRDCDRVFHLAAGVGVQRLFDQPVTTIDANLTTARVVFAAAAREGARVVYASSSEVYGHGLRVPFVESDRLLLGPPTSPRWSYGCAKAMGEWLALAHAREHGLRVTLARLFNTVGPRQRGHYGMVLPRFLEQAQAAEPITIYGDGQQTRCFASVHEVVRALVALSVCSDAEGAIVNVGSHEEVTMEHLASLVAEMVGSRTPPRFVPINVAFDAEFEDLQRRVPDLHKLQSLIGWHPHMPLREIVEELVRDLRTGRANAPNSTLLPARPQKRIRRSVRKRASIKRP